MSVGQVSFSVLTDNRRQDPHILLRSVLQDVNGESVLYEKVWAYYGIGMIEKVPPEFVFRIT